MFRPSSGRSCTLTSLIWPETPPAARFTGVTWALTSTVWVAAPSFSVTFRVRVSATWMEMSLRFPVSKPVALTAKVNLLAGSAVNR